MFDEMFDGKILIVYGPQASGKTRNKEAIQKFHRLHHVIDGVTRTKAKAKGFIDDSGKVYEHFPVKPRTLVLATMNRPECEEFAQAHGISAMCIMWPIENVLKTLDLWDLAQ